MRRVVIFLTALIFIFLPCSAAEFYENYTASNGRNVFIYHIPDEIENTKDDKEAEDTPQEDIVSDDVTADTSGNNSEYGINIHDYDNNDYGDEYISDNSDEDYEDVGDMYSFVLKGYAQYNEDDTNAVPLNIPEDEVLVLYIKPQVKVGEKYFDGLKPTPSLFDNNIYSKFNGSEYSIAPLSASTSKSIGGFSAGTTYSQGIDYGELEQSSGIFTKYQYKKFALSTSYAKTINTTNNNYNDNFYIIPELKVSQYLTVKNIFSADTVKRRKKAEIVISLNPFGNRDYDRLRLELGASETYDEMNNILKGQFRFSTNYKF